MGQLYEFWFNETTNLKSEATENIENNLSPEACLDLYLALQRFLSNKFDEREFIVAGDTGIWKLHEQLMS